MNDDLLTMTEHSLELSQILLSRLEQMKEEIPMCVGGIILRDYQEVTDLARSRINDIRHQLWQLCLDLSVNG